MPGRTRGILIVEEPKVCFREDTVNLRILNNLAFGRTLDLPLWSGPKFRLSSRKLLLFLISVLVCWRPFKISLPLHPFRIPSPPNPSHNSQKWLSPLLVSSQSLLPLLKPTTFEPMLPHLLHLPCNLVKPSPKFGKQRLVSGKQRPLDTSLRVQLWRVFVLLSKAKTQSPPSALPRLASQACERMGPATAQSQSLLPWGSSLRPASHL